ncbi:ATP-dependent DNA helicase RecG [Synechococcus sp. HK05]|uniref:ATP-dependent DNA helicase RecG n=1 Tax=Synechococcus sp. HK05 TaxID=2725975 RepID=UPI001C37F028|nr:ATP-dependent DNA helicase RecG [Synechococcus sp. HK05]MBV2350757.1 ATP-dependent DNA helicase RecG [Synechococcus sp. HK05]
MRPLQQGLQLEAERGFGNLQGRREPFQAFLSRSLREAPGPLPPHQQQLLAQLAEQFETYTELSQAGRQSLVRRTRQALHELQRAHEPVRPVAPPRLRLVPEAPPVATSVRPDTPLSEIKGVGPKSAARLAALDLWVARDLVRYYPRDYLDYSNLVRIAALEPGRTATIVATVRRSHSFTSPRNPNLSILELQLVDITGRIRISKFFAGKRFSSPGWLKALQRQYPTGATVAVSGLVKETPYGPAFQDPLMEVLASPNAPVQSEQIGRLLPVYGLTEGLTADRLRTLVRPLLAAAQAWPDPLPSAIQQQEQLVDLGTALHQIHAPRDQAALAQARRRLVFDEFLYLQLGLLQRRRQLTSRPAPALNNPSGTLLHGFLELLPFPLTGAQQRVLAEIRADLEREQPMARLVQGDVGSGKTVVAIAALLTAIEAGCQGALMAPTEVLAEQHYRKLCEWLPQLHVSCALLTGSTPARRRRELLADLANGTLKMLVGTHALLEDPVQFARLGLVVVDEQHRFGVHQRNRLLDKGLQPHLLTMTATPIPRTLALSLHGDLEVSQIDELPPGRTPIRTALLSAADRDQAYQLIREQVALGQRAYVVLPLVEDSEKLDLRSAVEVHQQLSEQIFPDLQVGLLHGRMASADKQAAIGAFAAGDTQVLVSTTVVEVGVDVPEASVMVIEHADRFGLAQLHQLRGRVGRGAAASFCQLINDSRNALARQRLEVLVHSTDGFEIAEMDLRLRGPGQVLGTRQSGLPDLALASLTDDGDVLEQARLVAQRIMDTDPGLEACPSLAQALAEQRQRTAAPARLN